MSEKTNTPEKEYTPEEIKKMRNDMRTMYKDENSMLKLQAENLKLQAEIEEYKVRRLEAMYKSAQIYALMQQSEDHADKERTNKKAESDKKPTPETPERSKRKLKKV